MCVDPEYQGQGVGKRLLQRGLEAVDKADQTVFLEATNAGSKLYLNAGFEVLEEFSLLDGRYKLGVMIRHPKQTSC
jgi:ribosomal protein S18 acetylase RimI-like enzyme